ncbi:MAG: acetylxylan esterase [Verrucomicrobiota bacterium]
MISKYSILILMSFVLAVPAGFGLKAEPELKDLNGFFPFAVPDSLEAWKTRASLIKRRVLVANGLFPLPERTPLKAVVHGRFERPDFTVEKVYFESYPGFHVTGLLFRPRGGEPGKRYPAVLSPHGHGGRLQDFGEEGVQQQIEIGGEKFADSGRFPKVARCGNLARLGCVVLLYDMIGYADSQQLSMEVGHRLKLRRPDMEAEDSWGFYTAQAEMHLQSIFGLQTWNSIRALDFLESLPDVDPARMAVTGGSGGGTQTIMTCAIDERPVAAFPNGMVSSSMQGGCLCENASLLRIGTGNVELTALFAPKPQGMTAADDWTREMLVPGKGFPELKRLYTFYGKPGNVMCGDLLRFKHNYNVVTRELMYEWFNRHLELGHEGSIEEADFKALTPEEHAVYNQEHPRPEGGDAFERRLTGWLAETSTRQLAGLPAMERSQTIARAWQIIVGIDDPIHPAEVDESSPGEGTVSLSVRQETEVPERTAVVPNPREIPAYTHGYNHSRFARQARGLYARILKAKESGKLVSIRADEGMEAIALAACAAAEPGTVQSLLLGSDAFRFAGITDWRDPYFVPGALKYGDVLGLLECVRSLGTTVSVEK